MAIVLNGSTGISTPNIDSGGTITASGITVDNTNPTIKSADADGFLNLSGGTTGTVGTQIRLYAESHATAANDIIFRSGGSAVLQYNASTPVWNFQAEDLTTTGTVTATSFAGDGSAITGVASVGVGQTWQNVTRSAGTTYQNTTGKPIMVAYMNTSIVGYNLEVSTNGSSWVKVGFPDNSGGAQLPQQFIVPDTHYYRVDSASAGVKFWTELR